MQVTNMMTIMIVLGVPTAESYHLTEWRGVMGHGCLLWWYCCNSATAHLCVWRRSQVSSAMVKQDPLPPVLFVVLMLWMCLYMLLELFSNSYIAEGRHRTELICVYSTKSCLDAYFIGFWRFPLRSQCCACFGTQNKTEVPIFVCLFKLLEHRFTQFIYWLKRF